MHLQLRSTLLIALITSFLSTAGPCLAGPPAPAAAKAPGKAQTEPARVNINTAGVHELMTLSGSAAPSPRESCSTGRPRADSRRRRICARFAVSEADCSSVTAIASS